jgi:hypothetical protein
MVPSLRCLAKRPTQRGSAALEVLLLIVILVLPLWMMLVNMGYNGVRYRHGQAALRLGAFQYVAGLTRTTDDSARTQAQSTASGIYFPGESDAMTLSINGASADSAAVGNAPGSPGTSDGDQGFLGSVSQRKVIDIAVVRNPPYADLFPRQALQGRLILASNTWTYCEMKDDQSGLATVFDALSFVGKGLWLFGGCGGGSRSGCASDLCG